MIRNMPRTVDHLKPIVVVMLILTSPLAGCVDSDDDGDNHPDHHDNEPGLHHHGDEDYHHQHDENNTAEHAESDRHHCHDDQDNEC